MLSGCALLYAFRGQNNPWIPQNSLLFSILFLNPSLSLIAPSWYLNIFDTNAIKKSKSEELIELSNKCTKNYIRKAFIKKPN